MSGINTEIMQWLLASLFWIGALMALFGAAVLIKPDLLLRWSGRLNRWISTTGFFQVLDAPHQTEHVFYRHHRLLGLAIVAGSAWCLYTFIFGVDSGRLLASLPVLAVGKEVSAWLYGTLYNLLLAANALAIVLGLIVFIRPSLLKGIESWANHWVRSEKIAQPLDETHFIPEKILPGNVRVFALVVLLGGLYIMSSIALYAR